MATLKKNGFGLIGKSVTHPYRSGIGHGTVVGIAKQGKTRATTMFKVRQHDHHTGEPPIRNWSGGKMTVVRK